MRKAIFLAVLISAMFGIGCAEQQLERMDRIVADVNDISATGMVLLQSPAARLLPPDAQLYGAVAVAMASIIVNGWQQIRGNLMKKTTKAIVKGIEASENQVKTNPSNPVKVAIGEQLRAAGIYDQGDKLIRELKIAR